MKIESTIKISRYLRISLFVVRFWFFNLYLKCFLWTWKQRDKSYNIEPTTLPKISVITPSLQSAEYIEQNILSVKLQGYEELEHIVVDGGSTDGTIEIVERYTNSQRTRESSVKLIKSYGDRGMYDAIATGFSAATGEIFCYLNSDDLFEPGSLPSIGRYFAAHPEVNIIYHDDILLHEHGWRFANRPQPKRVGFADLLAGHILYQDGVFFRRRAYETVGGMSRDLRLAGDFDLWLRLAERFRLVHRPGHQSAFRVRQGQLSDDRAGYRAEMSEVIVRRLAGQPLLERSWWKFRRVWYRFRIKRRRQDLFFPRHWTCLPPPAVENPPSISGLIPRSPIDGARADRFLFSTPDTRFGERELTFFYLDSRYRIAVAHPEIDRDRLAQLYETHYSAAPTETSPPPVAEASPWRNWFGGTRREKFLLLAYPAIGWAASLLSPRVTDTNALLVRKLLKVIGTRKLLSKSTVRLLDVGCFEGDLLNQIRKRTDWQTAGIELNPLAAERARAKGHTVWIASAEDALTIIPPDAQFDIIVLGQVIEHLNDPTRTLARIRLLLAPGGLIVLTTPNLDSAQVRWFGPTWAHWHPPYHRYIFSPRGLRAVVEHAGLSVATMSSHSYPYWSAMSVQLNAYGLGGAVSHAARLPRNTRRKGRYIAALSALLFDWRLRGDDLFVVCRD
ncbi:MAG TPA: methyltransferase domain-containing protein [Bauldia sp.]|nr:methyltransferase domain-containing protein [Bauldia sp.]